jgi:hypothetical protein
MQRKTGASRGSTTGSALLTTVDHSTTPRTCEYAVPRKVNVKGMGTLYAPSSTELAMMVLVMNCHPRGLASPEPTAAVGACHADLPG